MNTNDSKDDDEFFNFGPYHFNVSDLLRQMESGAMPYAMGTIEVAHVAEGWLGMSRTPQPDKTFEPITHQVDPARVEQVTEERLAEPVLMATTPHGNMLIDGFHRIAKAYQLGIEALPAHLIVVGEPTISINEVPGQEPT